MKHFIITTCIVSAALFSCTDSAKKTESASTADTTAASAKMDETPKTMVATAPLDSATMMKNWMAYMTPGDVHKMMASWNGTWSGDITMWQAPGAPAQKSKGTTVNKMMMGGRYQVSNHTGNMMGMPFEGMGTLAYDNDKKIFINTWVDNMGTGIMKMEGPWDEANKTITLTGTSIDPMSGKDMAVKETFKVVDDKTQLMEMFGPGPDGKEFKMMEIKFTRK